jgi:T5SS/PEP-CTERM-associated repeat protein
MTECELVHIDLPPITVNVGVDANERGRAGMGGEILEKVVERLFGEVGGLTWLLTKIIIAVSLVPVAAQAQTIADWSGGDGNWSDASKWTCSTESESGSETCVPNGSQYAVQIENGKVNVDVDVSVIEVVGRGTGAALSISGHSLNATLISGLASVEMANKAAIRTDLGLLVPSLTMRDSSILGIAAVASSNLATPSAGELHVSGSNIQRLALRGSMQLFDSIVGTDASPVSSLIIESASSITNSQFTGGLLIDNGGSLNLTHSVFTIPPGGDLIIGSSGAGSMQADNGSQITVAEGVLTQIGVGPSGTGTLTLDEATFTSNDRVSVGDGGTGSLVFHNGATLSAASPQPPASTEALLLGDDSTVQVDVSPSTAIDSRGPATLLGKLEFQQFQSQPGFEPGTFLPVLRATLINIPKLPGHNSPYLRLSGANPQQFTAIDMAGNSIGHLSFALPNNTAGPVLIPTACQGSLKGCTQDQGTFIGVVATNGKPKVKTSFYASRPTTGVDNPSNSCSDGVTNEFSIIASATTPSGKPISMGVAAAALGYDHFNFTQTVTEDTAASTLRTMAGTAPIPPYDDPPLGGWNEITMDSLQMGSIQSLLIVVAVAFSPAIILFLADAVQWFIRQARGTEGVTTVGQDASEVLQ